MFEEFLAAEHIQGWSLQEILDFVRKKSGEPLWRNVISNVLSLNGRQNEVEAIISEIEDARSKETNSHAAISRDLLLADIAFSSARKSPKTSEHLINKALTIIESGDWLWAQRDVLRTALTNFDDSNATTPVDDRIKRWAPRRKSSRYNLFEVLRQLPPADDLCDALFSGLYDEDRFNQQSAAEALAKVYGSCENVQQRLRNALKSSMDLSVTAAALEALTIGWPATTGLSELHDKAACSQDPTLRLVGISGRLASDNISSAKKRV